MRRLAGLAKDFARARKQVRLIDRAAFPDGFTAPKGEPAEAPPIEMRPFIVADTEDDSKELLEADKSGFDKKVTQIAALSTCGRRFHCDGAGSPSSKFFDFLFRMKARGIDRVYFHNLQYDLGNLFADELDELDMVMVGGRLIRAKWHGITFLDSFNLLPASVASLGKQIGLKKLRFDATGKAYVFRDCEIIMTALTNLFTVAARFGVNKPANTLGGLCVQIWKGLKGKNHLDATTFSRAAIYGGRTEIFSRGGVGNIALTDINSLYPWAMTLPFPGIMRPTKKLLKYGITRATVFVPDQPFAPLPFRVEEKDMLSGVHEHAIIFPCGRFTGTWTNAELFNAREHHGVVIEKIHESMGTNRASFPYRNFCERMYEFRMSSESEAHKLVYKLLMNNLYGQLGMGGMVTRTCQADPAALQDVRDGKRQATVFGSALLFDVQIPLPDHVNFAHAAHVTAYGRIRLLEFMRKIGPERLIYTDTDSCFFFCPKDGSMPFETGKKLGDMKFEGWADMAIPIVPKTYRLVLRAKEGKKRRKRLAKAKGVPKRFAKTFIESGRAEYAAPFKIREAINFFDREAVTVTAGKKRKTVFRETPRGNARRLSVWRKVFKELRSGYHKKTIRPDGRFHPLTLS